MRWDYEKVYSQEMFPFGKIRVLMPADRTTFCTRVDYEE